jgi:hypothetical protein
MLSKIKNNWESIFVATVYLALGIAIAARYFSLVNGGN